jgi:serine protease
MKFYKYKSLLIVIIIIVLLVSFGCIPTGNNDNQDIEYKIQVTWYPQNESGQETPPIKSNQDTEFTIPEPEKKFRIMEENMGKFGRIILKFNEKLDARDINPETNTDHAKFKLYGKYNPITPAGSILNFGVITPPNPDMIDWRKAIEYYDSLPEVLYAEPDYYVSVAGETQTVKGYPNDPQFPDQWHMLMLDMPNVWDFEMGEPSVTVAVLDTGVAYMDDPDTSLDNGLAPDLQYTAFDTVNAWDYINNDGVAYDDNSHGTHVAGTIAQTTNNGLGCSGMAPGVTILPMKVVAADTGTPSNPNFNTYVAAALERAADAGADVVNMSLIGTGFSQVLQDACTYAYNAGVIIFACSGNNGSGSVAYPSAYDHVISIGAVDPDKVKASFSQYGLGTGDPDNFGLDLMAPGGDGTNYYNGVLQQTIEGYNSNSTDYSFVYRYQHGTSQASPHAAGLAALLKSFKPSLTNDQIEQIMINTAEDLGSSGVDEYYANGLINPMEAILMANLMGIDEVTETFEGNIPADTGTAEHIINVAGGEISITLLSDESLTIELIGLDGEEVLETSLDGILVFNTLAHSGDYTIRISD